MSENNEIAVQEDEESIAYLDENDPRNVLNLVTKKVKEAFQRVIKECPQYLKMSELDLRELLKPTEATDRIRISFWKEYYRAQDEGVRMRMRNICAPVMTEQGFYESVLPDNERVAWILCVPGDHMVTLLADINYAKESNSKILRMNLFDEKGNIDIAKAKIWQRCYETALNRAHGAVIQRIEQKTQSMHIRQDLGSEELKKEYELLKSKHAAPFDQPMIDVNNGGGDDE